MTNTPLKPESNVSCRFNAKSIHNLNIIGPIALRLVGVWILGIAFLLCAGCSTTPKSAGFASVMIPGKTSEEIQKVAVDVFRAQGYQVMKMQPDEMIFQREGSTGQSLAYNGIAGTYYGAGIAVRVRTEIVDLIEGKRLQCQAFMVRNAGDAFFEEETRVPGRKSEPYQKTLDQIAERLK